MAGYSIFAGTIADMTWLQVEAAAKRGASMLVPIAVIEQHGPHLPLATDTYGAYFLCTTIREELAKAGIEAVVAPPYYFGINSTTWMFPGSLTVRRPGMVEVLTDIFGGFARAGFKQLFVLNHHGDPEHNDAIMEAIRNVREQGVDAIYTMGGFQRHFIQEAYEGMYKRPLPLPPEALLVAPESEETRVRREAVTRSDFGVHAEERETSLIMRCFPETVDPSVTIKDLVPVMPTMAEFNRAAGEMKWRELSPLGYVGDPSVAAEDNGELYAFEAKDIATAMADRLRR
jgi:creatinine amidohydrolase